MGQEQRDPLLYLCELFQATGGDVQDQRDKFEIGEAAGLGRFEALRAVFKLTQEGLVSSSDQRHVAITEAGARKAQEALIHPKNRAEIIRSSIRTRATDLFTAYKLALEEVLREIGKGNPGYVETLALQQRLLENLNQARHFGETEMRRAERAEVITRLNEATLSSLGITFNELIPSYGDAEDELPQTGRAARGMEESADISSKVLLSAPIKLMIVILLGLTGGFAVPAAINWLIFDPYHTFYYWEWIPLLWIAISTVSGGIIAFWINLLSVLPGSQSASTLLASMQRALALLGRHETPVEILRRFTGAFILGCLCIFSPFVLVGIILFTIGHVIVWLAQKS